MIKSNVYPVFSGHCVYVLYCKIILKVGKKCWSWLCYCLSKCVGGLIDLIFCWLNICKTIIYICGIRFIVGEMNVVYSYFLVIFTMYYNYYWLLVLKCIDICAFRRCSQTLESLCTNLYDVLRPLIIHINHLETLAELCSILKVRPVRAPGTKLHCIERPLTVQCSMAVLHCHSDALLLPYIVFNISHRFFMGE